jgi:phenylpyruvate tautomerase PptA (4-oxalocrotonate tautomerase family)
MPYFEIKTSVKLDAERKEKICHELGRIIELVPGKSESWVMVQLQDGSDMCFAGDSTQPVAAVVLKTFGELESKYYDILSQEICQYIGKLLEVDPKRMYVTYEPVIHWGWNSTNF